MPEPLLEIRDLSKTFPGGNRALDDVALTVHRGEIVAIVGQNGSGKSTLIKVLAGYHAADPGARVELAGGMRFIHQDLALIPGLSTIENLELGRGDARSRWRPVRGRRERAEAARQLAAFGASFDVTAPVSELSPAEQSIVAIARALDGWTGDDNLLVLDEPTAALHQSEVGALFAAVRRVASRGAGVIFVSHRLGEVRDLADRVVVLRDGCVVADVERGGYSERDLVHLMTGEWLEGQRRAAAALDGLAPPVIEVDDLCTERLDHLSFDVRQGEIIGLYGLVGSGMEQVNGTIFGALPRTSGSVRIDGEALGRGGAPVALARGIGYVPSDRRRDGAFLGFSVRENLTLPWLRPLRGRAGNLQLRKERHEAAHWISRVDVRPRDPERPLAQLSGGNQQKVVIAKWLRTGPRVLLLDEPTQGVDVAAKAAIHGLLADAARGGSALVVASTDTRELTELCNRVIVLRDGRPTAVLDRPSLSERRLVTEALGLDEQARTPNGAAHV